MNKIWDCCKKKKCKKSQKSQIFYKLIYSNYSGKYFKKNFKKDKI